MIDLLVIMVLTVLAGFMIGLAGVGAVALWLWSTDEGMREQDRRELANRWWW